MVVEGLPNVEHAVRGITPIGVLSPVVDLAALRHRLAIVSRWPGIGRPLVAVSSIHTGHWSLITSVPAPDGSGRPWALNWPYLLFEANFDGSMDEYLNIFTDVV